MGGQRASAQQLTVKVSGELHIQSTSLNPRPLNTTVRM